MSNQLSDAQQKVINFLMDNPNGYLQPSPYYHWNKLIKGNGEFVRQWCYRPTRDKLINIGAIIKNPDGNYRLNTKKVHIYKEIKIK